MDGTGRDGLGVRAGTRISSDVVKVMEWMDRPDDYDD